MSLRSLIVLRALDAPKNPSMAIFRTLLPVSLWISSRCFAQMRAPTQSAKANDAEALEDISQQLQFAGGTMPMAKLLLSLQTATKDRISRSGLGIEGYLRTGPGKEIVSVEGTGGKRVIILKSSPSKDGSVQLSRSALEVIRFDPGFICPSYGPDPNQQHWKIDELGSSDLWKVVDAKMHPRFYYRCDSLCLSIYGVRATATQIQNFEQFVMNDRIHFYVHREKNNVVWVCKRGKDDLEGHPPKFVPTEMKSSKVQENDSNREHTFGMLRMHSCTAEVAMRILPFVPCRWTNTTRLIPSNLIEGLPISKLSWWLAFQPKYFDVKFDPLARCALVRRSPLLNPEAYSLTQAQAEQLVLRRCAEAHANGGTPLVVTEMQKFFRPVLSSTQSKKGPKKE